ncbi:hypothetical protein J3R83DRAFT_13029 [Lanmaoa asiatica]|nr:hypothetical protein J3R83DRAFT_13029 [Lanmaoa asiatica]
MPWELPSVFSRLRRPVRRQPTPEQLPQLQHEPSVQQLPINRKILQDPSSFLEAQDEALPLGLTPSTRLPSGDGSSNTRSRPRQTDLSSKPLSERSDLPHGSSVDISPRLTNTISHISKIAAGGEWSTFGRKREHRVPDVAGLSRRASSSDNPKRTSRSVSPARDSKHLSADSTPSTFTLSRITNPSRERHSSPGPESPRQSPDIRFSSKASSPANTMSSKRHPRTPQIPPSYTAPVSSNLTTPVNRELAFDSPHTFGHPTPPENPSVAYPSPPPPLPPLDHPELAAVLSSRTNSTSTGQPTLSALRDRSNTLPTNRRTPRKGDLFPSLSFKLGRSTQHRSSLPQATQVFNTMTEQHETRPPDAPDGRRRARTVSAGARGRRTSADWSSYQASVGVNSHANQAWPAEVSREILRLSLATSGPDTTPGSSGKRKARTRGRSADPVRRPAMSPSFLPFPHPSRPIPPESPPPFRASATPPGEPNSLSLPSCYHPTREYHPDGRELIPPRSHSLHFDLGNRDSEQRAGFTMAQVKRSLSAIEACNGRNNGAGGATYTSLGLSDPAPTSSEAPPSLRLSSALTPSRPLFSGRVSPTNTHRSSSMHGEPSTPTPAPRQLSDKSRGKRKAEDNIDLTPPEQKKEGQHTTFLLPSETRSQRVSNSSHAPSSYHRKRARLSSTSPFATPVQSRAPSVQETPQSASRNHHFTSLSSSTGARIAPPRTPSRAASTRSRQPPTPSTTRKHERHQSMSQVSIPLSAFVSPHAPSISRSTKFHMRDPRKPPKKPNLTAWGLRFTTEDEPGSPIQAWCFFFGFLLFPVWWIAGLFLRVPTTRIAGDVDAEKGVAIDDPQIEHANATSTIVIAMDNQTPDEFLDSVEGEISFFRSVMRARPVGAHKHFHVLAIRNAIHNDTGRVIPVESIWAKLKNCYDLEALENAETDGFDTSGVYPQAIRSPSPSENLSRHPFFRDEFTLPADESFESLIAARRVRATASIPSSTPAPSPRQPSRTRKSKAPKRNKNKVDMAGLVGGDSDSSALTQESGDEAAFTPRDSVVTGTDAGTDYEDEPEVQEVSPGCIGPTKGWSWSSVEVREGRDGRKSQSRLDEPGSWGRQEEKEVDVHAALVMSVKLTIVTHAIHRLFDYLSYLHNR